MATASEQARYRMRDDKKLVQVRLSHAALARLDALVQANGATGRAEMVERWLTQGGDDPKSWAREAARLLRKYFQATGSREAYTRRPDGATEIQIFYRP